MKREDVDVSLSHGVLTISGERKEEQEHKDKRYLIRERRHGSFRRIMTLPEGVDESKIKASFEDGVLEVKVEDGASAVEEQPRRIQIEG
jgi:HSP20 family protein